MKFTKMQGAGNDFIIINNIEENIPKSRLSATAAHLCQRRFSIGADGFMAVERAENGGDFRMLFFNGDGSPGEMCGNGARCIAKFGYENGLAGEEMVIETTAGPVRAWRKEKDYYKIRLNDISVMELDRVLPVKSPEETGAPRQYRCAYVELGNPGIPHLVVNYPGLKEKKPSELWELGSLLRRHKELHKGANVNFYDIAEGRIFERTFERGVEDFTYACGTGTGCTAAVLAEEGKVSAAKPVVIEMEGGLLEIEIRRGKGGLKELYLSGPAVTVCRGETKI